MTVSRRLALLFAAGLIAVTPASPALGQSAGDEQYADPLGQTEGGAPEPAPAPSTPAPAPTPSAPVPVPAPAPAADAEAAATPSAPGAAITELPRTGADARLLALVGAALALLGIGLRPRTADVRP